MGTVRFSYDKVGDSYLEVIAEQGDFRGRGIAHEMLLEDSLYKFLKDCGEFPLNGATFEIHGPGLIALSVRTVGNLGHLEIAFSLEQLVGNTSALIKAPIDYEELKTLGQKLRKLADRSIGEFTIPLQDEARF